MDTEITFTFTFSVYQLIGAGVLCGLIVPPLLVLAWRGRKHFARWVNERL